MSDKQRADHIQAKYWNGFITRTEAQNVFNEQAQVIQMQAAAMARFDAAISCIADKLGVTPQDVNDWVAKKVKEAEEAKKNEPTTEGSADTKQEVSRIVAA